MTGVGIQHRLSGTPKILLRRVVPENPSVPLQLARQSEREKSAHP
jgi:hypothetical protein